jgi:hypothetical protein
MRPKEMFKWDKPESIDRLREYVPCLSPPGLLSNAGPIVRT